MAAAGMCGSLALTPSPTLLRRHRSILSIQSSRRPPPSRTPPAAAPPPRAASPRFSCPLYSSQPAFVADRSLSAHRLAFFGRRDLVASILSSSFTSLPAPHPTDGFLVRLISIYAAAGMPDHALSTFRLVNPPSERALSACHDTRQYDRWALPLAGVKLSTPHHRIWRNCTGGSRRDFSASAFTARRMLHSVFDAVTGPPPVTQLMFYNQYDYDMEVWLEPENFLRNPALYTPRTNRLITNADGRYMLSDAGKKLLRSLIMLGYANHERGYCAAHSFTEGNVKVSKRFGEFALKSPICSHLNEWEDGILMSRSMTYTAVLKLFERFLEKSEGAEILKKLPQDMINLLKLMSLELVTVHSEQFIINHACMLSIEGRVGLSRRLDIILRKELMHTGDSHLRNLANRIMWKMPYRRILTDIVASHPLLSYWYNFSAEKRSQKAAVSTGSEAEQAMATGVEAQTLSHQLLGQQLGQQQALGVAGLSKRPSPTGHRHRGELLVALNRDAVNHPFDAIKSVPEVAKVWPYSLKEVVELLQFKFPLFLPISQENFHKSRAWTRLAMEDFWPVNPIFYQSSYSRAMHVKRNW